MPRTRLAYGWFVVVLYAAVSLGTVCFGMGIWQNEVAVVVSLGGKLSWRWPTLPCVSEIVGFQLTLEV